MSNTPTCLFIPTIKHFIGKDVCMLGQDAETQINPNIICTLCGTDGISVCVRLG